MNRSNNAELIMELVAITCFASLRDDVTGNDDDDAVSFSFDEVVLLAVPNDDDDLTTLRIAAFSIGLCEIDSRQRNIKCHV